MSISNVFVAGRQFQVLSDFVSSTSSFQLAEVLEFIRIVYSTYDDADLFEFAARDGSIKTWWRPRQESEDRWKDLFRPV